MLTKFKSWEEAKSYFSSHGWAFCSISKTALERYSFRWAALYEDNGLVIAAYYESYI